MSLIGQTLGQYRVVEFIGAGGMATVYKAYQPSLDRYVAVKVLPAQHALSPGFKERFILEARAVAQLSHPNILPIFDFGLEGDLSYFVMKYVPDHTLNQLMGSPMELSKVSHFINQVAGALDHAHARGILHRDIKPANMLLEGDWLLLADFGVAKITENSTAITSTGHVFGTPAYVSPEQAEGATLDHRTDIYSLGIVLYEMVIGQVPYHGTTPMRIINKHLHELPPAPRSLRDDLSEAIEQVILKALAKNPADRYNRAHDLAEALRNALAQPPAYPTTPLPRLTATPNRPKRQPDKPSPGSSRSKKKAATASAAKVEKKLPAPAKKVNSPAPQAVPSLKPSRSGSGMKMILAAGGLLLLLIIGARLFLVGNGVEGAVSVATAPGNATPAGVDDRNTPTSTSTPALSTATTMSVPTSTLPSANQTQVPPTPEPATSTATLTTPVVDATATPVVSINVPTPTPKPLPVIGGRLAIPVKAGNEFKVYVTGFDGAGMNGPAPVSLGHARQPMFRRDGQAIIVGGTATGALRGIFVTDGQGLGPNPLNDRSDASWPVWSPEGDEILFVDHDRGRTIFRQSSQLAASAADITQVQINNAEIVGNNIIWSDDNKLVFQGCADWRGQSGECGIWVTDADAIDPVRLTPMSGLPMDARHGLLTYMLAEDGDWDIYLLPLAGGPPTNLTNNNSQDGLAAIAPDGQSVAYISNESGNWAVWTITLSDNQKQKWFDLDPQRATIDLNIWAEERLSWTP